MAVLDVREGVVGKRRTGKCRQEGCFEEQSHQPSFMACGMWHVRGVALAALVALVALVAFVVLVALVALVLLHETPSEEEHPPTYEA